MNVNFLRQKTITPKLRAYWGRIRTHGMTNTSEYMIWSSMKGRCTNKNLIAYKYYGGRGIKVCSRWLNSFQNFIDDMGRRPTKRHTIDRIDNNGNYEPKNCRWATWKQQARNRRPKNEKA